MRHIINLNKKWSLKFDNKFFPEYTVDGSRTFIETVFPETIAAGNTVFDIGGGGHPIVSKTLKEELNLKVIGIDIDIEELNNAPSGIYDTKIGADISLYVKNAAEADIVVCQAALEHIQNNEAAITNICQKLKPGGTVIVFTPCRNAIFAKLNVFLPQKIKVWLLNSIFPESQGHLGFPAFYNLCTPSELIKEFEKNNVQVLVTPYWMSAYFSFFFPAYVLWRLYTVFARRILGHNYCETFILIGHKPSDTLI